MSDRATKRTTDPHQFLQIEAISKQFPGQRGNPGVAAVTDVSLGIGEGEFVALLGPSGCGKTTLLRIVAGQEQPTSGRVLIDGVDVTSRPPETRPVNMVFQTPALFPHMNVSQNVAFGPSLAHGPTADAARRVAEMLALVRLPQFGERRVTELSGGQAQRVALARALINEPKVLLLDEPLSALDLKLRQQMQLELKAIHHRLGTTFVYVTHDQEEAVLMADRIVLMNDGEIVQEGTAEDIYRHPASVFASNFIGHSNLLAGRVAAIDSEVTSVQVGDLVIRARGSRAAEVGREVWISMRPENLRLADPATHIEAADNHVLGTVADRVFLGPSVRFEIEANGGRLLSIQPAGEVGNSLAPGSRVLATWSVADTILLTE
jgi:spermidine/putrescine transport system ATP-binding protein